MRKPLANYEAEYEAFRILLNSDCKKRILLFRGESGCGKTTLIKHCLDSVPESIPHIPIELREVSVNVAEVFYRCGHYLGWSKFPHFAGQVAALQENPEIKVDRNWLMGINNNIRIALKAENQTDRQERQVVLTEAWFEDLKNLEQTVILAFDVYEHAIQDVKEWISGPFLARAARINHIRVVIGGQMVPDDKNIEWGSCSILRDLGGVSDPTHWLPVVDAMQRRIPGNSPLDFLAGVCVSFNGRPNAIVQVLEGLPLRD